MKTLLIIVLNTLAHVTYGQGVGPLRQSYDSLRMLTGSTFDSTLSNINHKIDHTQLKAKYIARPEISIQLTGLFSRIHYLSLHDSLLAVQQLDSIKQSLQYRIDSLQRLNIPAFHYQKKLDSIRNLTPASYMNQLQVKETAMKEKMITLAERLNHHRSAMEQKLTEPLGVVNSNKLHVVPPMRAPIGFPATTIGSSNASLPETLSEPYQNAVGKINRRVDGGLQLSELDDQMAEIKEHSDDMLRETMSKVEGKLGSEKAIAVEELTDKAQGYSKDAKNIAHGNISAVEEFPDAIEKKVINQIEQAKGETGDFNKYQDIIGRGNDAEAAKQIAKQEIVKYARNHFAGKQQVLQAAMDKLAKFKSKLPEATTLTEIPNRWTNQMKGKPLIERLVPGLTLQIQHSSTILIDFNPNLSFRWTGRLTVGAGWNERVGFLKWNEIAWLERTYGPRIYSGFAIGKGFSLKGELEKMNAFVPNFPASAEGTRQWVWSVFAGMKKEYRFLKRLKGNVQLLYNVYDDHDNSPYPDKLNVRMGFELNLK